MIIVVLVITVLKCCSCFEYERCIPLIDACSVFAFTAMPLLFRVACLLLALPDCCLYSAWHDYLFADSGLHDVIFNMLF